MKIPEQFYAKLIKKTSHIRITKYKSNNFNIPNNKQSIVQYSRKN